MQVGGQCGDLVTEVEKSVGSHLFRYRFVGREFRFRVLGGKALFRSRFAGALRNVGAFGNFECGGSHRNPLICNKDTDLQ